MAAARILGGPLRLPCVRVLVRAPLLMVRPAGRAASVIGLRAASTGALSTKLGDAQTISMCAEIGRCASPDAVAEHFSRNAGAYDGA